MSGPDVPVVALVCSAGVLDAMSRVSRLLPKGFPAAVVVLQHTQPDAQSWLVDILARRTALPVVQAVDGLALAAAWVVVVPPGPHTGRAARQAPAGDRGGHRGAGAVRRRTALPTVGGPVADQLG